MNNNEQLKKWKDQFHEAIMVINTASAKLGTAQSINKMDQVSKQNSSMKYK